MEANGDGNGAEDVTREILIPKFPVIPKFASFKPPPKPDTEPDRTTKSSASSLTPTPVVPEGREKRRRDDRSEKKSRKHSHRTQEDPQARSRSPDKHRDKRRRTVSPPPTLPSLVETDLYRLDTKGDSANVTYGTSYRYSVPNFHRFGAGFVLGLPAKWRIDRERGEGKGLIVSIRGYDSDKRRKGGNLFAVDASRVGRLKPVANVAKGFGPNDEFVTISGRVEDTTNQPDVVERDYRSIEGKAKVTTPDDVESVSSDDEETFSYSEELRQRTVELDRKLQAHPHDIQAWLDYVALQDDLGVGQKASTAEIKLGILQKGLEKNPGNTKIFVEIFKLETILWEPKRVLAHWDEILKKHENPELILEYLNYRQTSFVSFTYPEIIATYTRCLSILRKLAWTVIQSEKPGIERTILYVIHRFARLAREAGYNELAIACFQGMMELNLFRPDTPPPTSEKERDVELEQFEEFWDSECPRFGEQGAKGWKLYDPDEIVDAPVVADVRIVGATMEDWYRREEQSKGDLPARTTDDVNEDDPFRVVLFNDIRPFMYAFTTDVIYCLPHVFLSFCGLNLPPRSYSSNDTQITDTWLHNDFDTSGFWPPPVNLNQIEWINGEAVEPERLPGIEGPFTFKRKAFPTDIDSLFLSTSSWFERLEDSDFGHVNLPFFSTALIQLKSVIQDEWLMVYHLAIENIVSPSTVLKLAKSYLKAHKTSTLLWTAYALLLWCRNDVTEARKVWRTAIEMTFSTRTDPVMLWRTWIAAEFELDPPTSRELFAEISAERPTFARGTIGGAGEMKVRKFIQDSFDRTLSFKHWDSVEGYAVLGVLLEYLSSGLESAITKCGQFVQLLRSRDLIGSVTHERILFSVSRVLYRHAKIQGWYRLSTLRDFWTEALATFPHNTAFLSLFAWNEANARIDGRVRKLLTSVEKTATVDTWVFAVWAEISLERGRVSEYAVRAVFEKAVESIKMSVLIWSLYIEFEAKYGRPERAKEILFRAVRECPWCKDLAMMAFGMLRALFDRREVAKVYNVLMEKEIRIHGELEGMDDGPRKEIELPVDESSGDEQ